MAGKYGCTGKRPGRDTCDGHPIKGTDRCKWCCGTTVAKQRAKGEINMTLRRWGVDDIPEDPLLLTLKLMTITEWRRQEYEDEINRVVADSGLNLADALIGEALVIDKDGGEHKVGEYIRGIVQLEQQERRLGADLALKVLAAGVQERLTRVQEQVGLLVADVIRGALADHGIDPTSTESMRIVSTRLHALGGAA